MMRRPGGRVSRTASAGRVTAGAGPSPGEPAVPAAARRLAAGEPPRPMAGCWPAAGAGPAGAGPAGSAAGPAAAAAGPAGPPAPAASGGPAGRLTARRARRSSLRPALRRPGQPRLPISYFLALSLDLEHAGNLSRQAPGRWRPSRPLRAARELFVRALWCGARSSCALRIQARCLFLSLISAPALRPGRVRPGGGAGPALPASRRGSSPGGSGPCASRVTSGGDDGARADMRRSATRMSSGRTAGVMCRTTIRSIAHPASCSGVARRSSSIVSTAARVSSRRTPLLVRRSTSALAAARNASTARAASAGATPGRTTCHSEASSRGASGTCGQVSDLDHVNPVWQRGVQPDPHVLGDHAAGEGDLQVLSLAGRACRRPAGVRNLGMRREASGIGDWQSSHPHSPLHCTRDIPVARKTHPAALSVPDDQPLNRRQRRPVTSAGAGRH